MRVKQSSVEHDAVLVLLNRITYGFSLAEYERAQGLGYEAYLEEQLDHLSIDDSDVEARLARYPSISSSPKQLFDRWWSNPARARTYWELKGAKLLRSVYSKRQLFERMVEFWSDHFNIDHHEDLMWMFMAEDHRTVAMQHALGSFPDMLSASAHSGAMLYYLDNWVNKAGIPQENYARELMELHTLGVDGGYDEQDVKEVAKCLTGWTLVQDEDSSEFLRYRFDPELHEPGPKSVVGLEIQGHAPEQEAEAVIDMLSRHPSTARFVSRKMIRWFLTEDPPRSLVDRVSDVYLETNGDIKSMLRVILARENLERDSSVLTPKFRRPFHLVTSLLRGLGAEIRDPRGLLEHLVAMGHAPFDWPQPNGFPDKKDLWGSSLLPRWSFVSQLADRAIPDVKLPDYETLGGQESPVGFAQRVNLRVLGGALASEDEERVQRFVDSFPQPPSEEDLGEAVGLAASAPGYQWF